MAVRPCVRRAGRSRLPFLQFHCSPPQATHADCDGVCGQGHILTPLARSCRENRSSPRNMGPQNVRKCGPPPQVQEFAREIYSVGRVAGASGGQDTGEADLRRRRAGGGGGHGSHLLHHVFSFHPRLRFRRTVPKSCRDVPQASFRYSGKLWQLWPRRCSSGPSHRAEDRMLEWTIGVRSKKTPALLDSPCAHMTAFFAATPPQTFHPLNPCTKWQ